jgi:hypothetical protein
MQHEGPKRWYDLDYSLNPQFAEPARQRQHLRAEPSVDP